MFFCVSNFWPGRPIKIVGRSGMDYPISYRLVGKWRQWIYYIYNILYYTVSAILGIGNVYT